MLTRIIVPLDDSECARRALDLALDLAQGHNASLRVCSVVDPLALTGAVSLGPVLDIMLTDKENAARRLVKHAVDRAREMGINASGETLSGVPGDEILRYAKRENAGVIVMGTHGYTGLERFV